MVNYHMAEVYAPVAISTDLNRSELIPQDLQIYAMNDFFTDLDDLQVEAKLFLWDSLKPLVVKTIKIDKLVSYINKVLCEIQNQFKSLFAGEFQFNVGLQWHFGGIFQNKRNFLQQEFLHFPTAREEWKSSD